MSILLYIQHCTAHPDPELHALTLRWHLKGHDSTCKTKFWKFEKMFTTEIYYQESVGTTTIFRQCVSQKHGFLFLEKFLVWLLSYVWEREFPDFYGFISHFPNLINFQKISSGHRWRTLQMALDLELTLKALSESSQIKILLNGNRVPL